MDAQDPRPPGDTVSSARTGKRYEHGSHPVGRGCAWLVTWMPRANRIRSALVTGYRAGTTTTSVAPRSSRATVSVAAAPVRRSVAAYRPTRTVGPVRARGASSVQSTAGAPAETPKATSESVDVLTAMPAGTTSKRNGTTTGTAAGASASASRTTSASVSVSVVADRTP